MRTVTIHKAKIQLSRLVRRAAMGEPFVIAKGGRPLVKVVPLTAPDPSQIRRRGFMRGLIEIPADFDRMGEAEIERLFGDAQAEAGTVRAPNRPISSERTAASKPVAPAKTKACR